MDFGAVLALEVDFFGFAPFDFGHQLVIGVGELAERAVVAGVNFVVLGVAAGNDYGATAGMMALARERLVLRTAARLCRR